MLQRPQEICLYYHKIANSLLWRSFIQFHVDGRPGVSCTAQPLHAWLIKYMCTSSYWSENLRSFLYVSSFVAAQHPSVVSAYGQNGLVALSFEGGALLA